MVAAVLQCPKYLRGIRSKGMFFALDIMGTRVRGKVHSVQFLSPFRQNAECKKDTSRKRDWDCIPPSGLILLSTLLCIVSEREGEMLQRRDSIRAIPKGVASPHTEAADLSVYCGAGLSFSDGI